MLVSCDDFGMLFFRSLNQYRSFLGGLSSCERRHFHRPAARRLHLRVFRPDAPAARRPLLEIGRF